MPDNDDLRNRLVALEQQLGLTTRNDNHIQANTDTNVSANINWRALYTVSYTHLTLPTKRIV